MNIVTWKSYKQKRKVRSTLAAETTALTTAIEQGELIRAHALEFWGEGVLDKRALKDQVQRIPLVAVTDCKSLFDYVHKKGAIPENRRLALDLEIIRDQMREDNVQVKWVSSRQQLADCFTKDGLASSLSTFAMS